MVQFAEHIASVATTKRAWIAARAVIDHAEAAEREARQSWCAAEERLSHAVSDATKAAMAALDPVQADTNSEPGQR